MPKTNPMLYYNMFTHIHDEAWMLDIVTTVIIKDKFLSDRFSF